MSTRNLIILLVPLVFIAGFLASLKPGIFSERAVTSGSRGMTYDVNRDTAIVPTRITVVGVYTCLPHRNTDGPQTMECAFGVREDESGQHYSIDTRLMASMIWQEIPTGSRVQVEGIVTPVEMLSSDHWQKYDIVGIISATMMEKL